MLSAGSKLIALSLVLSPAACGGALTEPFTPPESGGPPWVEVASKHVVLRTDLPVEEARDACVEFERIYTMFEDIAFPYQGKPKGQTRIVLFQREAEYAAIGPKSSIGYFHRALAVDDYFEPTAVFYGDLTVATRLTFQHEITHRFIDFYFPRAPVWLHEGMAEYYSTMTVEDNKVVLGRDLPNRFFIGGLTWTFQSTPLWPTIARVPIGDAVGVGDLIEMDRDEFYSARGATSSPSEDQQRARRQTANYASAWALVHLLLNGPEPYPELFGKYLERLAASSDPISAWSDTFGGADEQIEKDYRAWLAPKDRIPSKSPLRAPPRAHRERARDGSGGRARALGVDPAVGLRRPPSPGAGGSRRGDPARSQEGVGPDLDGAAQRGRGRNRRRREPLEQRARGRARRPVGHVCALPAARPAGVAGTGRGPLVEDGRALAEGPRDRDVVPRAERGGAVLRDPAARGRGAAAGSPGGAGRSELLAMLRHAGAAPRAEGRV